MFNAIPRQDKQLLLLEKAGHNGALRTEGAGAAYCRFVRSVYVLATFLLNHTSLHTSAGAAVS